MMKDITDNYSKIQKLAAKFHSEIKVSEGSDLTLYPLFRSCKNYLNNLHDICLTNFNEQKSVFEIADKLVVIDFDSI